MRSLAIISLILFLTAPGVVAAQKIYLTPNASSNQSDDTDQPPRRTSIYLTPQTSSAKQATRSRSAASRAPVNVPVLSSVSTNRYRMDLSSYSTANLSGLKKSDLLASSDPPKNITEMRRIAAAQNVPRVKQLIEMQKSLENVAPPPILNRVNAFQTPVKSQSADQSAAPVKKKKTIYIKPDAQSQSRTWKLWGNNR